MKPVVKEWLVQLFENEIKEAKGTIENERIWTNGSLDDESISLHESNIEDNEEYIEILEEMKNELEFD